MAVTPSRPRLKRAPGVALAGTVFACLFTGPIALGPAWADTGHYRFEAYWGGLHAADFVLSLDNGGTAYGTEFRLATRGLVDAILKLRVNADSAGAASGHDFAPARYHVAYTNRYRARSVRVTFPPDGPATARTRTERGDQAEEEYGGTDKLPAAQRAGTIDPVSALAQAIAYVRHAPAAAKAGFRLGVFDGRRRYDLIGRYVGETKRSILGRDHQVLVLRLETEAIAGFRQVQRLFWDDNAFHVYLSNDGRYRPLQIDSIGTGPIMHMVEECAAPCRLKSD